jgi:hypothetical protein
MEVVNNWILNQKYWDSYVIGALMLEPIWLA